MQVFGLEDEYASAANKPKLVYIKRPAPDRDARLTELLDRIKQENGASYKSFSSPAQLRRLIENDLALMLSERFTSAG
jgi:hypothetical protein